MAETILLEIVTPTGVALREQVTDVTAPSVAGEFGVLPGHLPLLAALRTGLVTYHKEGREHRLAVHHGFVEVAADVALLLTERFARAEDVDVVKTRMRLKEVDEELDHWHGELTDPRRRELIEEEQWLATELELIGDPPPPMVREDTRFLVNHAEPPPEEELAASSQPDESLTDHKSPGSAFPDTK
ncbi:ATP synthase F1 subunit epsilon [Chondromyces crocatus]|uniref:ATP synthase epsilon chain n=1 Tax=Chondromyces crocatus TaxID=52 RepID=A0A0K1EG46_CHOCO|nr:ATP synthase F1 subunit epsilon [Chondromyces crocatus]AKT39819.1 H+-transporting two-sector ATPase [Chondromyces crocatus]